MKSQGQTPIQSDWCPYKKRRAGLRHVEGRSREDTWRGRHLHTQDRGLGRQQTCPHLHLGLLASRLRNSKYPLFMCWVWGAWWQQPKLTHAGDKWVLDSSGKVAPSQGGQSSFPSRNAHPGLARGAGALSPCLPRESCRHARSTKWEVPRCLAACTDLHYQVPPKRLFTKHLRKRREEQSDYNYITCLPQEVLLRSCWQQHIHLKQKYNLPWALGSSLWQWARK